MCFTLSKGHTNIWSTTPHISYLFSSLVVVEQAKAIKESLSPWRNQEHLGINTHRFSSMSKLLSYLYSNASELEYSLVHIMIITCKLVHSLCVMFLICSSKFFIVHQISRNRGRTMDGIIVRCAVMVAPSRACQSEGLGSREVRSCFQLREHGVRVCGDQRICRYPTGRGVGG